MTSSPARAVLRAELTLFAREPGSIFWIIGFPTALIVILGLVPVIRDPVSGAGTSILALYANVAVLLAVLMSAVSAMPVVFAAYREQRILRRIATTPARPVQLLTAQYVIYGAAAVVGGVLALVVARLAYGVPLPRNPFGFVLVWALLLGCCLSIGGLIGGLARTVRLATAIGTAVLFPLMFTAGVWLPVPAMPGLLGDVVALTPLGAGAIALGVASAGDWPGITDVVVVAVWTALLGALAARLFRWE